jgi:hypothetical protein
VSLKGRTVLAEGYLVIWLPAEIFLVKIVLVLIFVWKICHVLGSKLRVLLWVLWM